MTLRLNQALRIPVHVADSLALGKTIVVNTRTFIHHDMLFALYPDQQNEELITLTVYAERYDCIGHDNPETIDRLSYFVGLPEDILRETLATKKVLWLTTLRVFQLPKPLVMLARSGGQFIPLPEPILIENAAPILTEEAFTAKLQQFQKLELPADIVLEDLVYAVQPFSSEFADRIKVFLGYQKPKPPELPDWIKEKRIITLGDRSVEEDTGKPNHQAGTDFENIAKQACEFLGFTVEEAYRGGAGGLDLYCSRPYPLVGECKSGKRIPSATTEELVKLGGMHLSPEAFLEAKKLIIGPGEPTRDVIRASERWRVSIMTTHSLQKLVELHARCPINLIELKEYLTEGIVTESIDRFINKVRSQIKLRSFVIACVQELESSNKPSVVEIRVQFNAKYSQACETSLDDKNVHEILIELSSPLAGYLGRIKGDDWKSDRFYFLRDLPLEEV